MKKIVCLLVLGLILIGSLDREVKENKVESNNFNNRYEQIRKTITISNQNVANKEIEFQSKQDFKGKTKIIVNGEERKKIKKFVQVENEKKVKQKEIEESIKIKLKEEEANQLKNDEKKIEEGIKKTRNQNSNRKKNDNPSEPNKKNVKDNLPQNDQSGGNATQTEKQKINPSTVGINRVYYHFKNLSLNTNVAQSYIDKNPNSFGLWKNVVYSGKKMNIMFGHDYGSGKLVKKAKIGDTLVLSDENGNLAKYTVVSKVVVSIEDYYSSDTKLWRTVGKNFDLMIKTCEKRNVTDLVITLQRIRE